MVDGNVFSGWACLEIRDRPERPSVKQQDAGNCPHCTDLKGRPSIAQTRGSVKGENGNSRFTHRAFSNRVHGPAHQDAISPPDDRDPSRTMAVRSFRCRRIR
jgi:hypothetical protein